MRCPLSRGFSPLRRNPDVSSNRSRIIQIRVLLRPSAYHAVRRFAPDTTSLVSFNQARPWGSVPFRALPVGNHRFLSETISPRAIGNRFNASLVRPEGLESNLSPRTPTYPSRLRGWPQSVRRRKRFLSKGASVGSGSSTGYLRFPRNVVRRFVTASLQGFEPSGGWDPT